MHNKLPETPPELAAHALGYPLDAEQVQNPANTRISGALHTAYVSILRRLAGARRDERLSSEDPFSNTDWQPVPQDLDQLKQDMHPLAEQMHIATNVATYIAEYKRGTRETGLRINQKDAFDNILTFLQRPPERVQNGLQTRAGYIDVPTAYGKTYIMTELVRAYSQRDPETQTVTYTPKTLILVPRKLLVRQTMGKNGKKGFSEFASDVEVTPYYSEQKDLSGDVVVMTYHSFNRLMKLGELDNLGTAVILCDEAHHTLGETTRKNLEAFRQNKIAIGLTASSEYRGDKKVEHLLPQLIHQTELRAAIEGDILSGIQCWSYKTNAGILIDDVRKKGDFSAGDLAPLVENGARNLHAIDFAKTFVEHGLQGIIACIPGGDCAHAQNLAKELQKTKIINTKTGEIRTLRAAAIGGFLSDAERNDLLDKYDAGELDVLTFVKMIGEGWDSENAKFLINLCPTSSPVRAIQRLGRILRPNGQLAQVVEFIDDINGTNRKIPYTFMHALGEDVFRQGLTIRSHTEYNGDSPVFSGTSLPEHIQQRLHEIEALPVDQLLVTPKQLEDAPAGWIPISDLLSFTPGLYSQSVRRILGENGFDMLIARSTINTPTYFFPPEALEYLKNAELDLLPDGWNCTADLARNLDVTETVAERLLRDINATGKLGRRTVTGRRLTYYSPEVSQLCCEAAAAIATATSQDFSIKLIANNLGADEATVRVFFKKREIVGTLKRTGTHGSMAMFFTESQAAIAMTEMKLAPMIQPGWASCHGLATELGIDRDRVDRYIKKHFSEETGQAVRITTESGRVMKGGVAFPPHIIEAARQALKPQTVPDGWQQFSVAISELGIGRNSAKTILKALNINLQSYAPRGRKGLYVSGAHKELLKNAWETKPQEGWLTAHQLADSHNVSLHIATTALGEAEGKDYYAPGFTGTFFSPKAIEQAQRTIVAGKIPEGWILRTTLAERFDVSTSTITNLLKPHENTQAKTTSGVAFSPETVAILEETYGKIADAQPGWHSVGEVAIAAGVAYKTARQQLLALTKNAESEHSVARAGTRKQIATVFAPQLVTRVIETLKRPELPDGWTFLDDLAEELQVSTTTLGEVLTAAKHNAMKVRGRSNYTTRGYSAQAATYARELFAAMPIAQDGWLTTQAIADQVGIAAGAVRSYVKGKAGFGTKQMRHKVNGKPLDYYSPEQAALIAKALKKHDIPDDHQLLTKVAAANGVGYAAILRLLRAEGFDLPEYRMPDGKVKIHLTPEGVARVVKEYDIPFAQDGWLNLSEIGNIAGVSSSAVAYHAKKLDITQDAAIRMRSRTNKRPFDHYSPADVSAILKSLGRN